MESQSKVGHGTGNLTKEILKNNPSKMYLVEKDNFLAESLKEIIDERVIIFNCFRNRDNIKSIKFC